MEINKEIFDDLINILNSPKDIHKINIDKQKSIKDVHIYCKLKKLSGQVSGSLIENYIINNNDMVKSDSSLCIGDCVKNNKNIEIKISLGGNISHNKFNYVQIRLNHNIDLYIFTAYLLTKQNINNMGEIFIFSLKKKELINIILKYGNYSHGTKKNLGDINRKSLESINNNKEYSIRPKYNSKCWMVLMNFRINKISSIV